MSNFVSLGDLAQSFQMRRHQSFIKADLNRLARELSTGRVDNVADRMKGDFSPIASIEHSLTALESLAIVNKEAGIFSETMQHALGQLHGFISETAPNLLIASNAGQSNMTAPATGEAKQKFQAAVATLNTEIAGRSLFSGAATDQTPLISADAMLAQLQIATATETTASGIEAQVDAWLAPGGGFETMAYRGSLNNLSPMKIGTNETATLDTRADAGAFREMLKGFALASLVHDGALALNANERSTLLGRSGETLLAAQAKILDHRANLGSVEAQIEQASVRNGAEKAALELVRGDLLEVDRFETATQLESAQAQLETLYTLTARLSRLSLTDFLR